MKQNLVDPFNSAFSKDGNIVNQLLLESNYLIDPGLFRGKMGFIIYFYECGRHSANSVYTELADELLDELVCELNREMPRGLASGLAGIGWGIEYLLQHSFIEASSDVIDEIDALIMETDIRRITDHSIETGLAGLLHYILARIKGSLMRGSIAPFDSVYMNDLYSTVQTYLLDSDNLILNDLLVKYNEYYLKKVCLDYDLNLTDFILLTDFINFDDLIKISVHHSEKILKNLVPNAPEQLYVINDKSLASGYGLGTYFREYIYCLKRMNLAVSILNLSAECNFFNIQHDDITQYYFPHAPNEVIDNRYYRAVVCFFRLYLNKNSNIIFHLNYEYTDFFLDEIRRCFPGSKIVATIHSSFWSWFLNGDHSEYKRIVHYPTSQDKERYGFLLKDYMFSKVFYNKVDRLIVLCEDMFSAMQDVYGIQGSKIEVVDNGLRDCGITLSVEDKEMIKKKYHLMNNEKLILYVGRLQESKGILNLLDAIELVLKQCDNFKLIVVGLGLEHNLKAVFERMHYIGSKIVLKGDISQKQLIELYQIVDIGIIPSYVEQCSYVGIEMLMNQLPIIASDAYGVKNMFNESNALVAEIGERKNKNTFTQNISNKLIEFLTGSPQKIESIALKGRGTYEYKYNIQKMESAYFSLFSQMFLTF